MEVVQRKPSRVLATLRPGTKMSVSEFTQWIDGMDSNGDGVISKGELEKGLKSLGLWFTNWKSKQAINTVDSNNNGLIDTDEEVKELIEYAQKNWGFVITDE